MSADSAAIATGGGMSPLERRYRQLMRAYPRIYRSWHEEELIGTLLAASTGRDNPPLREAAALITGGLAARARGLTAVPAPWWVDGLHLGVFLLTLANLAHVVAPLQRTPVGFVSLAGMFALALLTMLGKARVALALAVVAAVLVSGPIFGLPYVDGLLVPGSQVAYAIPQWVIVVGLAVLSGRSGRELRRRSWLWFLVPVAIGVSYAIFFVWMYLGYAWLVYARAGLECALLLTALWMTHAARDGRWAIASLFYVSYGLPQLAWDVYLPGTGLGGLLYWAVIGLLTLAVTATAYRARTRTRPSVSPR